MRLTDKAIEKIDSVQGRAALMIALGFGERWIMKCLQANKNNGPLTTAVAVATIREETGLKQSEILEEVPQEEKVA